MCLKATPSRKVPQKPTSATSKWGRNREERAALLRVRTGPEALRAIGGSFFKLCDSKREREKINRPEHTASRSQNKGTEKLQRRASLRPTSPSPPGVGGRGEVKGANSAPEMGSPPTLQTGLQFLFKDFLRFWIVNILWEDRG